MFAGDPFNNTHYGNYEKGKSEDKKSGSYGVVYKAKLNGETFAIKKIRVRDLEMKFLKREIDALIKLKGCKHIVTYHQIWFTNKEGISLQFSNESYHLDQDDNVTSSDLTKGRGSEVFRAPELHDCDEIESMEITGIVDVYSFGLIYYLMCLKRKVENKELRTLAEILRTYRFYYKEISPLSIEQLVLLNMMLVKDPAYRITIRELYKYCKKKPFKDLFCSKAPSQINSNRPTCFNLHQHENRNCFTFYVKLLSAGKFGDIYKAKYEQNYTNLIPVTLVQCFYAHIKCATFQSEKLKSLDHRNILKYWPNFQVMSVNSIGDKPNRGHFFVMENVKSTLKSFIKSDVFKRLMASADKRRLMKQILEGVIYLHDNGILHLNLNPDNILITDNHCPKICNIIRCNKVKYSKFHWFHFANNEINYVDAFVIDHNNRIKIDDITYKADIYSLGLIFAEFWFESKQQTINAIKALQYGFFVDGTEKDDIKKYVDDGNITKLANKKSVGKLMTNLLKGMIHILPSSRMDRDQLERYMKNKKLFPDALASTSMNLRNRREDNAIRASLNFGSEQMETD
ncbi:hypothetical protein B4U80_13363 [Leptotrombidium deliense]|uniref:Protein kinase domain-containing protein n=1 Tax=Leptotrombidium deliense TaxID=299467 RepID=A0A443S7M8_9ACAR|nr:hypothetical protein B4U80_13363 [Leptotrombidium deliense]